MEHQAESYRALERLCRRQAAISATPGARVALQRMSLEYQHLADQLEAEESHPRPPPG
jgi:hypothetical protein